MKSLPKLIITILSLGLVITTLSINDVFSKPVKEGKRCYTDGRKDGSGNYITTCCYASYDGGKFQGRFCEDCTIHDGGDVIICDDPYEESSRNPWNIRPDLNDNVIDQPLTADPQPSPTNDRGELSNKNIEQNLATLESNNSETASAEFTTSFSKKGNTQNSPIPPECPKQGPIPPNCTMKPKF